ncbi:MAG: hypothetical protein AAF802_06460 [Planctomycetota bacterium]
MGIPAGTLVTQPNSGAVHGTDFPDQAQPAYFLPTPGMDQRVAHTSRAANLSNDDIVNAWDTLRDPRLRWMQKLALRLYAGPQETDQRIAVSDLAAKVASTDPKMPRERLTHAVAHGVVEVRFRQHKLQTLRTELKSLRERLQRTKDRVEAGAVTKADFVKLIAAAQGLQEREKAENRELRLALDRVEVLTGGTLTQALADSLGDQPQVLFPGLADRIPASRLGDRRDVEKAMDNVQQLGSAEDVSTGSLLPLLSLRGYIQPSESRQESRFNGGFSIGDASQLDAFSKVEGGNSVYSLRSPIEKAMGEYHQVVSAAATDVRDLLDRYLRLDANAKACRSRLELAIESLEVLFDRFELDRASADDVAEKISDVIDTAFTCHKLEYERASVTIDLFVAIGGPSGRRM